MFINLIRSILKSKADLKAKKKIEFSVRCFWPVAATIEIIILSEELWVILSMPGNKEIQVQTPKIAAAALMDLKNMG